MLRGYTADYTLPGVLGLVRCLRTALRQQRKIRTNHVGRDAHIVPLLNPAPHPTNHPVALSRATLPRRGISVQPRVVAPLRVPFPKYRLVPAGRAGARPLQRIGAIAVVVVTSGRQVAAPTHHNSREARNVPLCTNLLLYLSCRLCLTIPFRSVQRVRREELLNREMDF